MRRKCVFPGFFREIASTRVGSGCPIFMSAMSARRGQEQARWYARQGSNPVESASRSVRRDQCEYGKGGRRIGHEHPAPGVALLPAVFAVEVERVRPPRGMYPLIDLDALLMSPEPLRPFSHRRMLNRNAGLPERVHDQPGRVGRVGGGRWMPAVGGAGRAPLSISAARLRRVASRWVSLSHAPWGGGVTPNRRRAFRVGLLGSRRPRSASALDRIRALSTASVPRDSVFLPSLPS